MWLKCYLEKTEKKRMNNRATKWSSIKSLKHYKIPML